MSDATLQYLKRHWKILLNIVTVGALLIVIMYPPRTSYHLREFGKSPRLDIVIDGTD